MKRETLNSKLKTRNSFPDWLWLAVVGLVVQWFWAGQLAQPAYMDAYYYTSNGARLADGAGFTEQVIWQFLDNPTGLPTPSHSYWMPLPSLLAAAGYLGGGTFAAAQFPFVLLTGLLPLLAYAISSYLSAERWQAVVAALFTMSGGYFAAVWNQPETFAPFAWAGGGCLLCLAWIQEKPVGQTAVFWLLPGLLAGLAHLTRADGLLFLLVAIGVWLVAARPKGTPFLLTTHLPALFFLLVGYLSIMGGWFLRNWLVWGRPLATAGGQTIFLTTYDDLFAYGRTFNLSTFLAWGWENILQSRLEGVSLALQNFVAVCGLIFLTPFVVWGWGKVARERPFLRPLNWYTLALFVAMSLIFTFPGGRGGLYHSSAALWPWCMALAPVGISQAVAWMAARLPHWQPERAKRLFSALFVAVAFIVTLAVGLPRAAGDGAGDVYEQFAESLPETAVVMVGDAPGFYYHTGRAAVSLPNESLPMLLQAADRYGVGYLVLDKNRPFPLKDLYEGHENHPRLQRLDEKQGYQLYGVRP